MSAKHYVLIDAEDRGVAVFAKKSLAFEERGGGQRVTACDCTDPARHIDAPHEPKWSRRPTLQRACIGCDRTEERVGTTVKPIALNSRGLCAACVCAVQEAAR